MATIDAQTYWMSTKIPNDQFLVYVFAGAPVDLDAALQMVRDRARNCPELCLRIADGRRAPATLRALTYPRWVGGPVGDRQFVCHPARSWPELLAAVAALGEDQLDPGEMTWRVHVFPGIDGAPLVRGPQVSVPMVCGPAAVVVVQIVHALADGNRSSVLAGHLLGRDGPVPRLPPPPALRTAALPARAWRAARTHRRLVVDEQTGAVAPQADSRPALLTNARPEGPRVLRTLVCRRAELVGPTVTVAVLAAISTALAAQLRDLGQDPATLGAEVPMAKAGPRRANNHFGNVAVGLYPELPVAERMDRIVAEFAARRRRAAHPAMAAAARAYAGVPAALLRWGVTQFDPMLRSDTVTGNTVVSSVDRGRADLVFGGMPVAFTAGYPGLSPMMSLTHGVHGIGDTVAVSVHATEAVLGGPAGVDGYLRRLAAALADPDR